ncbi:MAG: hypothetical protein NTX50_05870 [Candidatus Sumerlaeota bacterium]|nr:hypothetical protein [Candidatus Sumerlaeota bacterium]
MGLFKSKEERRIERDIQVRQGISQIRKQLKTLEKNEKEYLEKARRAKRIGSADQLSFLKRAMRQTISQRMRMERQLLAIETAAQMKNQAESYGAFAKSLNAVSKSIGEVFGSVDMAKTQKDFEMAIAKAETMEQRMDVFLDMANDSLMSGESAGDESIIADDELDRLIEEGEPGAKRKMEDEISKGLREIEKELGE